MIYKKNKTKIRSDVMKKIKIDHFNGDSPETISKRYGYDNHIINKYLKSCATKVYTGDDGIEWRRCSVCNVYRITKDWYHNSGPKYYTAHCKLCDRRRKSNELILKKNLGLIKKIQKQSKSAREKHGWKYKIRKRLLRIIGYLDGNGRLVKKKV